MTKGDEVNIEHIFLFIISCGLVGILLRRNILNLITSLIQVIVGLSGLSSINQDHKTEAATYFIIFFILAMVLFIYSIALLLIKRRSTLQINELTEMRG